MEMSSAAPKVVGYFTDVEGNWEYFQRCLALSSVLQVICHRRLLSCIRTFLFGRFTLSRARSGATLQKLSLFSKMIATLFLAVMLETNATAPYASSS
jgi:hypothetical protein